jgi:hypothetical protein
MNVFELESNKKDNSLKLNIIQMTQYFLLNKKLIK